MTFLNLIFFSKKLRQHPVFEGNEGGRVAGSGWGGGVNEDFVLHKDINKNIRLIQK